jgi:hypothetical protein
MVPERLRDRVYILGARSKPGHLTSAGLGSYEAIGRDLATDCREGTNRTWGHALLQHNASEVERLRQYVRPILFQESAGPLPTPRSGPSGNLPFLLKSRG